MVQFQLISGIPEMAQQGSIITAEFTAAGNRKAVSILTNKVSSLKVLFW